LNPVLYAFLLFCRERIPHDIALSAKTRTAIRRKTIL